MEVILIIAIIFIVFFVGRGLISNTFPIIWELMYSLHNVIALLAFGLVWYAGNLNVAVILSLAISFGGGKLWRGYLKRSGVLKKITEAETKFDNATGVDHSYVNSSMSGKRAHYNNDGKIMGYSDKD